MTKIIQNRMWVVAGIAALIAGFVLNLNAALWGNDAIFNTVVSLGFIIFWAVYLYFNRVNKKLLIFPLVISAVAFIAALLGAVTVFTDFAFGGLSYLAVPIITPLYGLRTICGSFEVTYPVIIILSVVWMGTTILLRKLTPVSAIGIIITPREK